MEKRNFYTPEEVREKVFDNQISRPHLYNSIKRGDIVTIRLGKKLLIPAWWCEKMLEKPV